MNIYTYHNNNPITPVNTFNTTFSDFYMPTETGELFFKTAYSTPQATYPDAYYDQSFSWSTAQAVQMTCDDTIDITFTLPQITVNSSGTGLLQGNIHYGGTLSPFEGASVFLIDSVSGTPINYTRTDINGDYSFDQVPIGNYFLNVDIFGLTQQSTHYIDVTAINYQFYNLNFEVDTVVSTRNPIGIYADYSSLGFSTETISNISVFPNPTHDIIYIESPQEPITGIKITDIAGKTIKQIDTPANHLQIDLGNKPSGIYFVTVMTEESSFVKKIVLVDTSQ